MFAKLLTLLSALGVISLNAPIMVEKTIHYENNDSVLKQRNYQHDVMINDYTQVTYKYETNDVNTIDDIVYGNIYHLSLPVTYAELSTYLTSIGNYTPLFSFSLIRGLNLINNANNYDVFSSGNDVDMYVRHATDDNVQFCFVGNNGIANTSVNIDLSVGLELDVVFNGYYFNFTNNVVDLITSSDYNVIESVTYIQPTTIIGYINEFLEYNLYSEIPYVRDISFNIGGEDINLLTWLIMLTGIIACGGFLFFMIKLFIWLFKIVSNSILLR